MAGKWVQLGTQALECTPNSEVAFGEGDLKGYGEPGYHDVALRMDVDVIGSSTGTVTAMTLAQRKTFLDTLNLDVRFELGGTNVAAGTGADEENRFAPYQSYPFKQLRLRGRRILRRDMDGLTDSTTGLATGWSSGAFTRSFKMYASLGRVEQILQNERLLGISADALELLRIKVRVQSDGLYAFNSALTITKVKITFRVLRLKSPAGGNLVSIPPVVRRYQPQSTSRSVRTMVGVPIEVVDRTNALASTVKGTLESVTVGGIPVNKRPDTLTTVHEALLESVFNASETDATLSDEVTEVFAIGDATVEQLRSGEVVAIQETLLEAWDVDSTMLAALREADVFRLMRAIAAQGLKAGEAYHFTSAASIEGLKKLGGELLPAMGLVYWRTTEPAAQEWPGWRVTKEGQFSLYLPPTHMALAAKDYGEATNERGPGNGNVRKMAAALNNFGRHFPGYSEDAERGFPAGDGSKGGTETFTYRSLRAEVQKAAVAMFTTK